MNEKITVINHALIKHKINILRNKKTQMKVFRQTLHELTLLILFEATKDLKTHSQIIETPLETFQVEFLDKQPVVIPILRAGLGMLNAFLELFPEAKVGFIGLRRDEITLISHEYYFNIPENTEQHPVFVVDPMLATGGSAIACVSRLKEQGIKNIRVVNIIAAPEGIKNFQRIFPEISLYVGVIDRELNSNSYIVPGLGDAGDRLFGTT